MLPTVQFEREELRADCSASGEFWQGGSAGTDHSKSQPGDAYTEMIGTTRSL
jgi:hypothetical protein